MLDWPGRVAVTVFLTGCAYNCPFCHNPGLKRPTSDPEQFGALHEYIQMRRPWIDGVVITGGEPTEDPGLVGLAEYFRQQQVPVKLDTNGSNPEVLRTILRRGLVQHVAMDVKATPARYAEATGCPDAAETTRRSMELLVDSGVSHEFRTTAYPGVVEVADLPEIAASIKGAQSYVIQQFRPDRTLDPRAASVKPHHPDALRQARDACDLVVPTTLRGV